MATRDTRRASKSAKRRSKSTGRTLNEILIDLGRQALQDGVRGVLEEHGIDSGVKVELALTKPKAKRKAARKAVRRRR